MNKFDDERLPSAARRGFVPERKNEKPRKAGDDEAEAEERVVSERLGSKDYEKGELSDEFLRCCLLYGNGVVAA